MLEQITQDVYAAQGTLRMPGGITFPVRMTIVRHAEGLWIHSPIEINDALAAQIDALGPVKWLVAPNCLHHLYFQAASARWPEAECVAAPGLSKKRSDLTFQHQLPREGNNSLWPGWMDSCFMAGAPAANETVFLHRPSGSLIVTDLVFNLPANGHNAASWLMFSMVGVRGRFAQSRLWRILTKDRGALAASVAELLQWDFQRIIPSHGAVLEKDTKVALRNALKWLGV